MLMSFPPATEMFQFAGFASHGYGFTMRYPLRGGLPHSEIPGSKLVRSSPRLFAAYHFLNPLLVPRHHQIALPRLFPAPSVRSEDTPSDLQSQISISYASFCFKHTHNNTLLKITHHTKKQT